MIARKVLKKIKQLKKSPQNNFLVYEAYTGNCTQSNQPSKLTQCKTLVFGYKLCQILGVVKRFLANNRSSSTRQTKTMHSYCLKINKSVALQL
jgi:hypothetical protein